jgi:hypothetical protein
LGIYSRVAGVPLLSGHPQRATQSFLLDAPQLRNAMTTGGSLSIKPLKILDSTLRGAKMAVRARLMILALAYLC